MLQINGDETPSKKINLNKKTKLYNTDLFTGCDYHYISVNNKLENRFRIL